VSSSQATELEGLKRCRQQLSDVRLEVHALTTDRHRSVKAYVRDHWGEVTHYYDSWHIGKSKQIKLMLVLKIDISDLCYIWKFCLSHTHL
jgi:GH18 family chitinase